MSVPVFAEINAKGLFTFKKRGEKQKLAFGVCFAVSWAIREQCAT